ncbi:MAG: hypothetical protein P9L99_14835 [Candidatus Lernaella stagnicola]|nr:hypothetical protein [Candidatus Lernaella stagnicola]
MHKQEELTTFATVYRKKIEAGASAVTGWEAAKQALVDRLYVVANHLIKLGIPVEINHEQNVRSVGFSLPARELSSTVIAPRHDLLFTLAPERLVKICDGTGYLFASVEPYELVQKDCLAIENAIARFFANVVANPGLQFTEEIQEAVS